MFCLAGIGSVSHIPRPLISYLVYSVAYATNGSINASTNAINWWPHNNRLLCYLHRMISHLRFE